MDTGNVGVNAFGIETKSDLEPRLDRLPWSRWHTTILAGLGFAWFLDSLEASIIGSVLGILKKIWSFSSVQGSLTVSTWLVGIMAGTLLFGYLADKYGRKKMFILTLAWYGFFTALAAFSPNVWFFIVVRFLAAVGIGGEYVAIGSAVVEFIPKMSRGKTDALVQSLWPLGAAGSGLLIVAMLTVLPPEIAWRGGFGLAVILAIFCMYVRQFVPESPRWLILHGRDEEARVIVEAAEKTAMAEHGLKELPPVTPITIRRENRTAWGQTKELWKDYPGRILMGAALNFSQVAFGYGSIAYTSLVLFPQTNTPAEKVPFYMMVSFLFATVGGLTATITLDRFGRKPTAIVAYGAQLVAGLSMIFVHTTSGAVASLCLMQYAYTWAWVAERIINSEIFPTRSRAAGLGWVICLGRIGGVISPIILTSVYEASKSIVDVAFALAFLCLFGFIAAVYWAWNGVEGKQRSLESMVDFAWVGKKF
jgi:MFS family permease